MENDMTLLRELGENRKLIIRELNRNTIAMRQATLQAKERGYSNYRIALLTGVTKRTIAQWLKKP
jgi:DNA-directed RNA polymerase specialized sigma24 family protein